MKADIIKQIKSYSIPAKRPDQTDYLSLSVKNTAKLSKFFNVNGREIEIIALENYIIPERYIRNMKTFSSKDQISLLKSKVSIVGLGGLGGTVAEILARIGIGTLALIDGDIFEDSNLNRQMICSEDLLTISKAHAAEKRVNRINSSIVVEKHNTFINKENAQKILENSDIVVDCLDNTHTRFIVENASKQIGAPMVSAAVAGSFGHITTIFPQDSGLVLIYGEPEKAESRGAELVAGNLASTVSFAASLEAAETVKVLIKKGDILRNSLYVFDLMDNTFEKVSL